MSSMSSRTLARSVAVATSFESDEIHDVLRTRSIVACQELQRHEVRNARHRGSYARQQFHPFGLLHGLRLDS